MRDDVKTVTYASIYGAQAAKISASLKKPVHEGKKILEKYFNALPNLKSWMTKVSNYALTFRKIRTMQPFRRIRYFEEVETEDSVFRKSINTRIQGSAADIMKLACVYMYNTRKEFNLDFKFRLQVHDEIIISCPTKELAEQYSPYIRQAMRDAGDAVTKKVKLDTSVVVSKYWLK